MIQTETNTNHTQIQLGCNSCTHIETCIVNKAFTNILKQHYTPETTPIQPENLANICKLYLSRTIIETFIQTTEENQNA